MRFISDIFDSLSTSLRVVATLTTLCVMGFGAMMTYGATYAAPKMAEDFATRAEQAAQQSMERRREAERARALANEGWGYDSEANFEDGPPVRSSEDEVGGWGE